MKKIAAFILALLYLAVSAGATVHLNYCMDKLVASNLLHDTSGKCSKCGMEKNKDNGCCKNEVKQLKIENDQNIPESGLQTFQMFPAALSAYMTETHIGQLPSVSKRIFQSHVLPNENDVAVYIRNCVFLI